MPTFPAPLPAATLSVSASPTATLALGFQFHCRTHLAPIWVSNSTKIPLASAPSVVCTSTKTTAPRKTLFSTVFKGRRPGVIDLGRITAEGVDGGRFSSSSSISIPSRVESPKSSTTKDCCPGVSGDLVCSSGETEETALFCGTSDAAKIGLLAEDGPPERDRLLFLGILNGEMQPSGRRGTLETTVFTNLGRGLLW